MLLENRCFNLLTIFLSTLIIILLNEILYGNNAVASSIVGTFLVSILIFMVVFFISLNLKMFKFNPFFVYMSVLVVYFLIGRLNLSTYRLSLQNINWNLLILSSIISLLFGLYAAKSIVKIKFDNSEKKYERIFNLKIYYILMIFMTLLSSILNIQYGFPIINPSNRFNVPTTYQYLVEFTVPATICFMAYEILKKERLIRSSVFLFWAIAICASLGYRNQILLLILGYILIVTYVYTRNRLKSKFGSFKRAFNIAMLVSILFIFMGLGFINRQENSTELAKWEDFISVFEVDNYRFVTPIMPLHLASREAMGVTEVALIRKENLTYFTDNNLFFLDLLTLLPGYQPSAGSVLGKVVNLSNNTSLTIGIIGGLYLSGGYLFLIFFMFLIGYINTFFWELYRRTSDIMYFSLAILLLVYSLELINRGLFKPMYLLVIVFPIIFFKTKKRVNYE